MNLTKFSPRCSHFGITIFEQETGFRRNGGSLCIKHSTLSIVSHYITLHHIVSCHIKLLHPIILSYQIASPHIPSYPILFYPIISHHIKPHHINYQTTTYQIHRHHSSGTIGPIGTIGFICTTSPKFNGLFQFISAPPCRGTPFFSTPPMEFPTAFLLHSMEFPTQVNHPLMEFLTLFTSLPWNFQHYLPPPMEFPVFCNFVSILNPLLGISSPKMPPCLEFSIWKKMPSPHEVFLFLDRGVRIQIGIAQFQYGERSCSILE